MTEESARQPCGHSPPHPVAPPGRAPFLAALRAGDFEGLIAAPDPDVVIRIDEVAARPGGPRVIRSAEPLAKGALAFARIAHLMQPVLVNGQWGSCGPREDSPPEC
jgi:RNA polymerase sigma-70 factor (ECF subfamily)